MLNDLAIKQFIEIYEKEFGVLLTENEARVKANKVFSFFKIVVSEISKSEGVINSVKKGGDKYGNKDKSQ